MIEILQLPNLPLEAASLVLKRLDSIISTLTVGIASYDDIAEKYRTIRRTWVPRADGAGDAFLSKLRSLLTKTDVLQEGEDVEVNNEEAMQIDN